MLLYDLKTSLRSLIKNKVYAAINVLGLSIGITCCIVILVFVRYELTFDNFQSDGQAFRVVQDNKLPEQTLHWNTTAYPLAEALRNDFPEFEKVTQASGPVTRAFSIKNENGEINRFEEKNVLFVDPYYLEVFPVNWLAGNPKTALTYPSSIILTESIVEKCFGKGLTDFSSILGKTILLNGKDPLTITGVIHDAPGNISLKYKMIVPYEFFKVNNPYFSSNWSGNYRGTTFVVMKENASSAEAEEKIASWKKKYLKPEDDFRISYRLQPLTEMHNETLYGSSPGSYVMPLKIISGAFAVALFILIIAAVNFVNLTTGLAAIRSKEVGVRKILGATRLRLIRQFLSENLMIIVLAIFVSLGLSQVFLDQINGFMSIIDMRLTFQWSDLIIVLLTSSAIVVLAAIYPAIMLSAFRPVDALKKKISTAHSNGFSLRRSLIVLQFAVVQLFIIGTIVVATQMNLFQTKELGFNSESVVLVPGPGPDGGDIETLRHKLLQHTGIESVSFGSGPPAAINDYQLGTSFRLPHQSENEAQDAEMKIGDTLYTEFYDLEIIAGRRPTVNKEMFDELLVNEKLIKALGWTAEEALGKKLVINEGEATVVGVVKNFHNNSLQEEISPCILLNWKYFMNHAFIKLDNKDKSETLAFVEKTWKELSPTSTYHYSFLTDEMAANYATENLVFKGFSALSFLAVAIGCMGLIGLMSFMTLNKTKEVGIRKTLGASISQIIALFSKEFIILILVAFLVATPIAYFAMSQWLQDFTYRVQLSWWMFIGGGILAVVIAGITVSYQSIMAARANPVDSLRAE
jgi:putative ABC transport system permease protein